MTDYIASDWIENTGTVPHGVGPDTRIEAVSRRGFCGAVSPDLIMSPLTWQHFGWDHDIIRFRFLETPAERDARLLRGIGDLLDAGRVAEQAGYEG